LRFVLRVYETYKSIEWQNTEFLNGTELAHIITTVISKVKKGYKSIRNSVSINLVKMNSTILIIYTSLLWILQQISIKNTANVFRF